MFIRNNKRVNINSKLIIDGVHYNSEYFKNPTNREAFGITEIPDPVRKDERFYFVEEIDDSPYVINTPKPLEYVKDYLWQQIKSYRDRLQSGGFKVGDKWYHSDIDSRIKILGLVILGSSIPAGLQWKTMDGTFAEMTQTLATQIFGAAASHDTSIFAIAENHRNNINALETIEELEAYDYTIDWPDTYETSV